jgi:hypothetical protein
VETKLFRFAEENVQLYHNIGYTTTPLVPVNPCCPVQIFNVWAGILKGTNRYNRVGDKISPRGMSLKLWIANKQDRPNIMYRIIIATVPKTIGGAVSGNTNVYPFDTLEIGACNNNMILPLDRDRGVKALYDRTFNLQLGLSGTLPSTGKEGHLVKKLWIKRKTSRPIQFDSTNAQVILNNPLVMYVIPYDSWGTPQTDNVASFAYYGTLYYKDY